MGDNGVSDELDRFLKIEDDLREEVEKAGS